MSHPRKVYKCWSMQWPSWQRSAFARHPPAEWTTILGRADIDGSFPRQDDQKWKNLRVVKFVASARVECTGAFYSAANSICLPTVEALVRPTTHTERKKSLIGNFANSIWSRLSHFWASPSNCTKWVPCIVTDWVLEWIYHFHPSDCYITISGLYPVTSVGLATVEFFCLRDPVCINRQSDSHKKLRRKSPQINWYAHIYIQSRVNFFHVLCWVWICVLMELSRTPNYYLYPLNPQLFFLEEKMASNSSTPPSFKLSDRTGAMTAQGKLLCNCVMKI